MLWSSHSSPIRPLLALLWVSLFVPLASAISVRQTSNVNNNVFVDCGRYSFIANLSTIASNTTYRSAYMLSTTDGSFKAQTMLNTAQLQLPLLIFNQPLNQQCGNASATALAGAELNFTNGLISEYKIQAVYSVSPNGVGGTITVLSMIFITAIFGALGLCI